MVQVVTGTQVPYLHAMTTNWETVTHGGETYKVLNDHAGNLTVTEWREQLEEYVEHMCDKTGIELLEAPHRPVRLES